MAKTLITGGNGFIGSHLVDSLLADGASVRVMVQPGSDVSFIERTDAERVSGDLCAPDTLGPAVEGIESVYHLAAHPRFDAKVPDEEYEAVNVAGTRNLLDACAAAGVKRVLYTSSIEAVGPSEDGQRLTEETQPNPGNIYGRTKLEGERIVREYSGRDGMETVIVRPPMIYGPREMILVQRLFRVIKWGFYPIIGTGEALTEFCYVKNQVAGIRKVMENGRGGETYFISDERSYTIKAIVRGIAAAMGVRVRLVYLPVPIAWSIGLMLELLSKVLRFYPFVIPATSRPPFSRKTVDWTSKSKLYCDISKAKADAGYEPRYSLEQGIRETVDWYRQNGHL